MAKGEEPGGLSRMDPGNRKRRAEEAEEAGEEWLLAAYRKLDERGKYRVRITIAGCLADGGGES